MKIKLQCRFELIKYNSIAIRIKSNSFKIKIFLKYENSKLIVLER